MQNLRLCRVPQATSLTRWHERINQRECGAVSLETEFDVTGTIARLFIYPVKSCAGIEVQEAVLTETGLDLAAPGWWWMRKGIF